MEAEALYSFSDREDELSFKEGSIVQVLSTKEDTYWYMAEQEGKCGLIPGNYVKMKPCDWYRGALSRAQAVEMLDNQPRDGAFLVRDCETSPGDFSVSVKRMHGSDVVHFKVLRDQAGKYFLWEVRFISLNHLVDHYHTSSVCLNEQVYLTDMLQMVGRVEAIYDFQA